jgi:hypothetical protein
MTTANSDTWVASGLRGRLGVGPLIWAILAVIVVLWMLGWPPGAAAGVAVVSAGPEGAVLTYRADPGERNHMGVDSSQPGPYRVSDSAGVAPGAGCVTGEAPTVVLCTPPTGLPMRLAVQLGDRADSVNLRFVPGIAARVAGGAGDDTIEGPGRPSIFAINENRWDFRGLDPRPRPRGLSALASRASVPGSSLFGGPGDDSLFGSAGNDRLAPGPGVDYVSGWRGDDDVEARDHALDSVDCLAGNDRLVIDRYDFALGRCGAILRRGLPYVLPLHVVWDVTSTETLFWLGCPADSAAPCKGSVALFIRGGRRVFRERFRIGIGQIGLSIAYLAPITNKALLRRGPRIVVRTLDAKGRPQILSRVTHMTTLNRSGDGG